MTEQEKARLSINEDAVETGVKEGFRGTVRGDFVEQKIERTVEVAGLTAEADDLNGSIDRLNHQIVRTRLAAIGVWVLCIVVFIGRFCMKGVF